MTLNKDDKIYSPQEIISRSKNYDGILSSVTDPINADTISKLSSSIKIIANGAVGFGNIDIQAAKAKGITVTNTPDVLTDATADIQILLLLGLLFFGIEYFLLGLGCFVMGFSFFSLVNNQSGSKGITKPYKGKSGKTYTAKQDREDHIV